jgi:UDP-N-acetyl-D-mannosaminuronate dehydrogenase
MSYQNGVSIVIGLGEVGKPLFTILSESDKGAIGMDIIPAEITVPVGIMHVCFPFQVPGGFLNTVVAYAKKYKPEIIVINSTVGPGTTEEIEEISGISCVYSPVRGKHSRMVEDLRRYVKFVAGRNGEAAERVRVHFESMGLKGKGMSSPRALELAKLLETTYFGLLISWAQEMNRFASENGSDYFEIAAFFDEIGYLPRVVFQPGHIGGHCVMQNIELLQAKHPSDFLSTIQKSNERRKGELEAESRASVREQLEPINRM